MTEPYTRTIRLSRVSVLLSLLFGWLMHRIIMRFYSFIRPEEGSLAELL